MITDRTVQDINSAKKIREEKIQKFIALTQDEIKTLEKGFITTNTLNRISSKQKEISDILNSFGINVKINVKNYSLGDNFNAKDTQLLLSNNYILRNSIPVYSTTPLNPNYLWSWQNVNYIEKILVDLESLITKMTYAFRHFGVTICGHGGVIL